jgi:hypothetical protein
LPSPDSGSGERGRTADRPARRRPGRGRRDFLAELVETGGLPVSVHVVPTERRRGVARRLLEAAADLSSEETDGLWTFNAYDEDDVATLFVEASGFQRQRRVHYFQARIDDLLGNIGPLLARSRRRGAGAAPLIIEPLGDAPLDEIGWLVSAELGGGPAAAAARMRAQTAPDSRVNDRSQVARAGDAVAGVILWRIDPDDVAVVDARVVAAPWRGGATNLSLLEAGLLRGKAEGLTEVRFHCDDTIRDTLSLARRAQAREIAVKSTWWLPFDQQKSAEPADA